MLLRIKKELRAHNFRHGSWTHRLLVVGFTLLFAADLFTAKAFGGPVENGLAEVNAALAARNLKWRIKTEFSQDPPESFRIEPYSSGGAYITGGDVRGLMYGLFEAAEQIRENGRFAKVHLDRAAALRGVRLDLDANLEHASEDYWRSYFQMLAHNRFNRAHVVFSSLVRPYRSACVISRAAADYAVDFTLGVAGTISADEMSVLLALCPAVRSVAVEPGSPSRQAVLEAAQHAGRFVTVDTDGSAGNISNADVTVLRPSDMWPPSFEIRASYRHAETGRNLGAAAKPASEQDLATGHEAFYRVWGRYGYDPKASPPKDANPAEYEAARLATLHIAAAGLADDGGSDHVASAAEAVRNLKQGVASAKFTPVDIAAGMEGAAAVLDKSVTPDFQLIANLAKDRAREERAAYARALREAESSASHSDAVADRDAPDHAGHGGADHINDHTPDHNADHAADHGNVFYVSASTPGLTLTRPQIFHKPYQNTAADQAMPVTVRVNMPKPAAKAGSKRGATAQPEPGAIKAIRLHYRTLDPQAKETILEEPAAPEVHFTIPGSDLSGSWDLFYYFEVLNVEGSGWFEPDPLTAATPYFTVHIQAPRTGPN